MEPAKLVRNSNGNLLCADWLGVGQLPEMLTANNNFSLVGARVTLDLG